MDDECVEPLETVQSIETFCLNSWEECSGTPGPLFPPELRSVYVAKPKRYFSSSDLMPSEAQMCLEASIPAAVFTTLSNSCLGKSTPSCLMARIENLRSNNSSTNSSHATGSSEE